MKTDLNDLKRVKAMINFDRSLRYQLTLFYGTATEEDMRKAWEQVSELAGIVAKPIDDVSNLGLKFGKRRDEQVFAMGGDGSLVPQPKVTWSMNTNPWQLDWTPQRIDVFFDARGYADTIEAEEVEPFSSIRDRVLPNLVNAAERLGVPIARVAAVITGEASCSSKKTPAQVVADIFFNENFQSKAQEEELQDVQARVNRVTKWQLDGVEYEEAKIPVNRIEIGEAKCLFGPDDIDRSLRWQLDVNTSPQAITSAVFSGKGINTFFEKAVDWVVERLANLDKVCS